MQACGNTAATLDAAARTRGADPVEEPRSGGRARAVLWGRAQDMRRAGRVSPGRQWGHAQDMRVRGRRAAPRRDDRLPVGIANVVVEKNVVAVAAARDPEGFAGRRRLVVLGPPGVVVPDDRGAPRLLHQRDGGGFVEARAAAVVVQRGRQRVAALRVVFAREDAVALDPIRRLLRPRDRPWRPAIQARRAKATVGPSEPNVRITRDTSRPESSRTLSVSKNAGRKRWCLPSSVQKHGSQAWW